MELSLDRRTMMIGTPLALLAASGGGACVPAGPSRTSAREVNRILDEFLAAYQAIDIDRMVALMAEDIYFEDPTFHLKAHNREEMKPIYQPLGTSFRKVRITPFNRIVAPPWGISQQRIAATFEQNGRTHNVDVQGLSMFEIDRGRIRRWYDYYDVLTFREQTRGPA
jgi:limonene-1,2-epoxide hydrolase